MRLEDLNWMDVDKYLKQDDRLILILGACEQHGFLSLLTDVRIPLALADAASKQTGIPVAPPLNFGVSPYFLDYPGTISIRISTLLNAVEDITRSVYQQGFRRILILNGHGGNHGARLHLSEIINEMPGLKFHWYSWWQAHSVEEAAKRHGLKPAHANWLEAFPFTIISELPEAEKHHTHTPSDILDAKNTRLIYGDGSFGGVYRVDDSIMQEIFNTALLEIIRLLQFDEFP